MKGGYKNRDYRRVSIRQEMHANCLIIEDGERIKWGRASRGMRMDPWHDEPRHNKQKSWKKKRKTQYRNSIRCVKNRQETTIPYDRLALWRLEQYFEKYDIPYQIIKIGHVERKIFQHLYTHMVINSVLTKVLLDKPIAYKYNCSIIDFVRIIWWSPKDIGIDRIIRQKYY
jgi:hypothetical protein